MCKDKRHTDWGKTKAKAKAWRDALPTPFVPKGVYRFKSHEEAQEWLERALTRRV